MSSGHYLQHLDPRYAVKTEAEVVYHAADLFGISSSTSPAHNNHHHNNHLIHGAATAAASPAAAHQQHHNSSVNNHHHHQLQQQQQQHIHQHHQPPPHVGYGAFTQILDAVNLASPASAAAAYAHHHHNNHHNNSTSSPSPTGVNNNSGGGGAIITAKEEPIEMTTAASINTTAVRTAPPAPKVPGRRRHIKPERKKFACDKCEFRTAARGNLILHDNSVHLKIKHPCDQCKYEATQVNTKFGHLFLVVLRIRMDPQ